MLYFGDEEINKSCIIEVQAVWTNKNPEELLLNPTKFWILSSGEFTKYLKQIWGEFAPNVAWKQSLLRSLPSEEPHKYCFRLWLFVVVVVVLFFFPLFFLSFQGLDDEIVDNVVADGVPEDRSEASLECWSQDSYDFHTRLAIIII